MVRWVLLAAAIHPGVARAADAVDYTRDVKPLLRERCFSCHGALKQNGKLRLDTVASMRAREVLDGSLLDRVSDPNEKSRMPPEGKPLTAAQIAMLKAWIEQGAKHPADEKPEADPKDHWAFKPPVRPAVPKLASNPIDAFLLAEQQKHGLKPIAEADKATLLRRVYLDLIGLPPTPDQLHAFLKDESPDAYEKVVDTLLASPQYGERWGRHWMDVWRYSDWYGRRSVPDVLNSYGQIWRWRDWIVKSINDDRPYDDMIRMMLAADELAPLNDADQVATGFVVRNFYRWNYNNWMRDSVEHTAKAFLGLTFNCCHCHDHKYDPITQDDYFRMRAVFEPLEIRHDRWPGEADPGVYPKYNYASSYKPITTGIVRAMDEKLDAKTHPYTGGDERNLVKDRVIAPGVPASLGGTFAVTAVNLPPQSWFPGSKPFVRAEELSKREAEVKVAWDALVSAMPGPAVATRIADTRLVAAKSELAALQARMAADDVVHLGAKGDVKTVTAIAARAERQAAIDAARLALEQADAKAKPAAQVKLDAAIKAMAAPITTYTPLSHVYPKSSTGRRAALAKWIASRDNPLTARVAMNHLWGWHFGRSLVETTANFGRSGKQPTHPELLDWLATEFMNNGWKQKPLHRLIVTSRAYRADTRSTGSQDTDNTWLARFPTNRLQAEVIRDSLLFVSGELDATIGGPDIPQDQGLTAKRRAIYFTHHGEARVEFLDLFDAANPCDAYKRSTSVLPQQALALSNSGLAIRLSRTLAANLKLHTSDEAFAIAAFERILSRSPRSAELVASIKFLDAQRKLLEADPALRARENLVLALFNHTDFVTVR
jgi:mono/diheme cytochrome c family protein